MNSIAGCPLAENQALCGGFRSVVLRGRFNRRGTYKSRIATAVIAAYVGDYSMQEEEKGMWLWLLLPLDL